MDRRVDRPVITGSDRPLEARDHACRQGAIEPERVRTTVHEALVHLEKRERITLRMNPADLEALKAQNIALLEEFDAIDDLEIIPDDSVAPGGCVAQSELLEVDARMESQFQKIVDALLE